MNQPQLSVIVITPDTVATVATTLRRLRAQSVVEQIELVLVTPAPAEVPGFNWVKTVAMEVRHSTAAARAAGVRAATAPVVAFVEDHSFPQPGWAAALLAAHQEPWAGVGPALRNGNPGSLTSWANLIIEYAPWLDPLPRGPMTLIPGHNSSYKRAVLLTYGDRLESMLDAEGVLHWDLQARGERLLLEPAAKTEHVNFSRLGPSLKLRFLGGRLFAAARARGWAWGHRLVYICGSPLIPLVRFVKILREAKPGRFPRAALPLVLLGLFVDGFGECIGYLAGAGETMRGLSEMEFHRERFLTDGDRQAWEAAAK